MTDETTTKRTRKPNALVAYKKAHAAAEKARRAAAKAADLRARAEAAAAAAEEAAAELPALEQAEKEAYDALQAELNSLTVNTDDLAEEDGE